MATMQPRKWLQKCDFGCVPQEEKHCRRNQILGDESIRVVAIIKDCCAKNCCHFIPRDKIKSLPQNMWLGDVHMSSTKKLKVHCNIHIDADRQGGDPQICGSML